MFYFEQGYDLKVGSFKLGYYCNGQWEHQLGGTDALYL